MKAAAAPNRRGGNFRCAPAISGSRFAVPAQAAIRRPLLRLVRFHPQPFKGFRLRDNWRGPQRPLLPQTLGLRSDDWLVLDALRRKRNVNDYTGDPIDPESVRECIARAEALLATTRQWIKVNHPALLEHQK